MDKNKVPLTFDGIEFIVISSRGNYLKHSWNDAILRNGAAFLRVNDPGILLKTVLRNVYFSRLPCATGDLK
jgi:hypothetical protein